MSQASFLPRIPNKREKGSPGHRLIWGLLICAYRVEGGWFHLFWRGVNAEERVFAGFLSGLQRFASLSYTSLYFRDTTFSIVEDTQLLLSERKEGVYAYVSQHLVFVIFMPLFWVDHE